MTYDPTRHHRRSIRLKGYDYAQPGAYFITVCARDRACLFGTVHGGVMRLNVLGDIVWDAWEGLARHYPHVVPDRFVVMPNHVHGIVRLVGACGATGDNEWARDNGGNGRTRGDGDGERVGGNGGDERPRENRGDHRVGDNGDGERGDHRAGQNRGGERGDQRVGDNRGGERGDHRVGDNRGDQRVVGAGFKPAPTVPPPPTSTSPPPPTPPSTGGTPGKRHGLPEIVRAFKTFSARRINEYRRTPGTPVWQRNYYEHIIRHEHDYHRIARYIEQNPQRWTEDTLHPDAPGPRKNA